MDSGCRGAFPSLVTVTRDLEAVTHLSLRGHTPTGWPEALICTALENAAPFLSASAPRRSQAALCGSLTSLSSRGFPSSLHADLDLGLPLTPHRNSQPRLLPVFLWGIHL